MKHAISLCLMLALCACDQEPDDDSSFDQGCGCSTDTNPGCGCGDDDEEPPPTRTPARKPDIPAFKLMQYTPAQVDPTLANLKSADKKQRAMAIMSLPSAPGHFQKHPALLAKVRDALVTVARNDEADSNRAFAISKIAEMGDGAGPAMPALIKLLEHPVDAQHVAQALGRLGKTGHVAIPRLIELLQDGPAKNRPHMAEGLGKIGPAAADAVPALIEAVKSGKPDFTRAKAAHALGKIGAAARSALPVLDENAKSGRGALRFASKMAAQAIRKG